MKPNTEQELLIIELQRKHAEIKTHAIEARLRIEQLIQQESGVLQLERSRIANRAIAAGISKTRIGRAIGTSNWDTVNAVLALAGPSIFQPEEIDRVVTKDWKYDKATMVMTLLVWNQRKPPGTNRTPVAVELFQPKDGAQLIAKNFEADVYYKNVETMWWTRASDALNVELGLRPPEPLPEPPSEAPATYDYDEAVRRAATDLSWEDEED